MSKKIIIADFSLEEDYHYVVGLQTPLPYYQVAYYITKTLLIDFYRHHQKVYHDGQKILINYYIAERQNERFFLFSNKECLDLLKLSANHIKANYLLSIFSESVVTYKTIIEEQHHFFITPIEVSLQKIQSLLCSVNDYASLPDHQNYPMYSL